MSYCRFSSDQFACDVYVYEHCGGWWQIHVAGNRLVSDAPRPAPAGQWWGKGDEGIAAFMAAEKSLRQWMDQAQRETLTLLHAGDDFECGSPGECADTLEMLRGLGYNVPQFAIDGLREEEALAEADRAAAPPTGKTPGTDDKEPAQTSPMSEQPPA